MIAKCHSYTGYPFRKTKNHTTEAEELTGKHTCTQSIMCAHVTFFLLPRKGHVLSEDSESSCCRIRCYLAMEQQSHDLLGTEWRVHASLWGEGLVWDWEVVLLLLSLLFNLFIPKYYQEKISYIYSFLQLFVWCCGMRNSQILEGSGEAMGLSQVLDADKQGKGGGTPIYSVLAWAKVRRWISVFM